MSRILLSTSSFKGTLGSLMIPPLFCFEGLVYLFFCGSCIFVFFFVGGIYVFTGVFIKLQVKQAE
jgi:hypothetical protein